MKMKKKCAVYLEKMKFWRRLSIATIVAGTFFAGIVIPMAEESLHQPRPEYVPYDYMYIRTKVSDYLPIHSYTCTHDTKP